jgi:ketosteroid isomerase-like protein
MGDNFMKLRVLAMIALMLGLAVYEPTPSRIAAQSVAPSQEIKSVLETQVVAWNRGDVVDFMKGYWNSPELSFAGSGGLTHGYQTVLEHYKKSYPDQKAMGHLDFSELDVRMLGKNDALVTGRWHLKRDADEMGGIFSLVFEKFPDGWKIIHDHTSAGAKK